MTLEEVASHVGVSRQTLSRYETGVIGNIPSDKVEALAKALRTTPAFLMGWEDGSSPSGLHPMFGLVKKPRLGRIACGTPIIAEQNMDGYDLVPDYVKCDYTLIAQGDSMNRARINDGDIVCVKASRTAADGQIVVASVEGLGDEYEVTLKRIRFMMDGSVILCPDSDNPEYVPLLITKDKVSALHIQGIATHFISKVI